MSGLIPVDIPKLLIPPEAIPRLTERVMKGLIFNVASSARNHWVGLGRMDTSVFRFDYLQGIQPVVAQGATAHSITLVGAVPHILEDGSPRLDMRTTLLGPNVPVAPFGQKGKRRGSKGQYYRAIPLRHTGPGATSKTVGQPMGKAYTGHEAVLNARKLGKAVYQAAKQLTPTLGAPYSKTRWGERLGTQTIKAGLKPGEIDIPLLRPWHKGNIYAGMVRMQKTYEKATQNKYMTFRTISTAVQDESWWRKEIPARHYAAKVERFVNQLLPEVIRKFVEAI